MCAVTLVVYALNPDSPYKVLLVFLQSFQLLFKAFQLFDAWFQRHLKSKYTSIGKMVAASVVATYKTYLLMTHKNIFWFAMSNSLSDLVISIILFYYYKKEHGPVLKIHIKYGIEVMKLSYHFIISGFMSAMYSQMDKIMIGQMLSSADVGIYTIATTICSIWLFVPTAIINSFRPKIMELKQRNNNQKYLYHLKQLYSSIIWMCILMSIMVFISGKYVISILYGEQYMGAVNPLKIAIWYETFAMIGTVREVWILCENKFQYVKFYLGIGTVVNLIFNLCLIPPYGINGAALATLITQITTSLIAPCFFRETRIHTKIVLQALVCDWFWKSR